MTSSVIETAAHEAHLDPLSGYGVLALPDPADDLRVDGASLHEVDWNAMIQRLDGCGWGPLENDETSLFIEEGRSPSGRELIALYCREPIHEHLTVSEYMAARGEVMALIA